MRQARNKGSKILPLLGGFVVGSSAHGFPCPAALPMRLPRTSLLHLLKCGILAGLFGYI